MESLEGDCIILIKTFIREEFLWRHDQQQNPIDWLGVFMRY
ncbi:hypothetical protein QY96_03854 [Bacillus thermotolerans]|nr:hypothetical protein QY96_03854 [Bacillus thermotolerans]